MKSSSKDKTIHFGVSVSKTQLNAEDYAIIDSKVHFKHSSRMLEYYMENPDERDAKYANPECTVYSDEWCKKHRESCLQNLELNIKYFDSLSADKFNKKLNFFLKKNKKFVEVTDLNSYKDACGIYIMVLDKYKQVYIGKSESSIKKEIMSYWSKTKEFDRLIFGRVEESRLSIASFGALDTTRIFVMEAPSWKIDSLEEKYVSDFGDEYILNRCAGGLNSNSYPSKSHAQLAAMATRKKRKFI